MYKTLMYKTLIVNIDNTVLIDKIKELILFQFRFKFEDFILFVPQL